MPFVNHAAFEGGGRHQQNTIYKIYPRQSAEQADYQVLVENIPSLFEEDLRIIQNKEEIPFWVEEKGKAWTKLAKLKVKTLLFALSGHPSAKSESEGENTFEFFDDFSGMIVYDFDKYVSNPLTIPYYSTLGPVHPCMRYFPNSEDGYKYWLFYETVAIGGANEYLDLVRSNDGITFVDTGISNHILSPSAGGNWDDKFIADCSVVKVGSTWYMYYCGVNTSLEHRIGLVTSSNGKTWTRITDGIGGTSKVLVPDTGLTEEAGDKFVSPTVYYDGTKFWMCYISKKAGADYCMCLAESTDGKSWTKSASNPVYEASGETIWHINVSKYDGSYYCYFCHGSTGHLRLLNSTNKTTWVLASNNPVLEYSEAWEGSHIYESGPATDEHGNMVFIDSKMWLYYSTREGTGLYYEIGLAKSFLNVDPYIWGGHSVSTSITDGILHAYPTANYGGLRSQDPISLADWKMLECRIRHNDVNAQQNSVGLFDTLASTTWYLQYNAFIQFYGSSDYFRALLNNPSFFCDETSLGATTTAWHREKMLLKIGENPSYWVDAITCPIAQNLGSATYYVWAPKAYNTFSTNEWTELDWIFVRKYASPEPLILKKRTGGKADVIKAIVSGLLP